MVVSAAEKRVIDKMFSKRGLAKAKRYYRRKARGGYRKPRSVPEWASVTESCALTNITGVAYNMNQMYGLNGTNLTQFIQRATTVAPAYQHYRIKKVTLEFKPQYDTFTPAVGVAGTGVLVPNLFYMINKSGSIPANPTIDNLRAMGSKPIRFDDKTIKVSWRPSVLNEVQGVLGDVGAGYKVSPWLSTTVQTAPPGLSTVQHLGIYFIVQRPGVLPAGMAELSYDVQITVDFQFKKPAVKSTPGAPMAIEYLNQSVTLPLTAL